MLITVFFFLRDVLIYFYSVTANSSDYYTKANRIKLCIIREFYDYGYIPHVLFFIVCFFFLYQTLVTWIMFNFYITIPPILSILENLIFVS